MALFAGMKYLESDHLSIVVLVHRPFSFVSHCFFFFSEPALESLVIQLFCMPDVGSMLSQAPATSISRVIHALEWHPWQIQAWSILFFNFILVFASLFC